MEIDLAYAQIAFVGHGDRGLQPPWMVYDPGRRPGSCVSRHDTIDLAVLAAYRLGYTIDLARSPYAARWKDDPERLVEGRVDHYLATVKAR